MFPCPEDLLPPYLKCEYFPYYKFPSFQIALVSLRLKKKVQLVPVDPTQECGLWKIEDRYLSDIKEKYIEAIKAVSSKVKIICFGEMTYPFSENSEDNQSFQRSLSELSKQKNLYIIAGSYHDFTAQSGRRYNTSLIYCPESERLYIQHKLKRAHRENECCDVPQDEYLTVVGTPYGNFVVPICLDVGNLNIWAKIKYLNCNPRYRGIQFVISPAFDPSLGVIRYAKILSSSKGAEICVAFVNSFEDSIKGRFQEPALFKSDGSPLQHSSTKKNIYIYNVCFEDCKPPTQIFPTSL